MENAEERNQKIIRAVLQKEASLCPGAVDLIGIYGSFLSGDIHPLSDLDLLIVSDDERAQALSCTFLQEDPLIGHDLYITSWDSLQEDASYPDPHIAKLMKAKILYCAAPEQQARLEALRRQAQTLLDAPFGPEDLRKAEVMLKEAMAFYAQAMTETSLSQVRKYAGGTVSYLEDAVAMLNKAYYMRGTKRRLAELHDMAKRPEDLAKQITAVTAARDIPALREALTPLMQAVMHCFSRERESLQKDSGSLGGSLAGTYEEMVSNWRGKMQLAAENGDTHLAFLSLASLQGMLEDLHASAGIREYDAFSVYHPEDLSRTAEELDLFLAEYAREYSRTGLTVRRYRDIDAFAADYLGTSRPPEA